jgi:hypothetical protein
VTVLRQTGNASDVSAVFDPRGDEVVTGDEDGLAIGWSTQLAGPIGDLSPIAANRVTRQRTAGEELAIKTSTG